MTWLCRLCAEKKSSIGRVGSVGVGLYVFNALFFPQNSMSVRISFDQGEGRGRWHVCVCVRRGHCCVGGALAWSKFLLSIYGLLSPTKTCVSNTVFSSKKKKRTLPAERSKCLLTRVETNRQHSAGFGGRSRHINIEHVGAGDGENTCCTRSNLFGRSNLSSLCFQGGLFSSRTCFPHVQTLSGALHACPCMHPRRHGYGLVIWCFLTPPPSG